MKRTQMQECKAVSIGKQIFSFSEDLIAGFMTTIATTLAAVIMNKYIEYNNQKPFKYWAKFSSFFFLNTPYLLNLENSIKKLI